MVDLAPPGSPWRFVAFRRYPDGRSQGDLSDARSRKLTFNLLAPSTLTLAIAGRSPQLGWLEELRSDIAAYRWSDEAADYVPMFRGCVNASEDELSPTVHTVTVGAVDYRGVLARRSLRAAAAYAATEQFSIAEALVAAGDLPAGVPAGGRLGLSTARLAPDGTPLVASGVVRDRAYLPGQVVSEALDNLSTDISGFDWSVDPAPGVAGVVHFWYPQRGTPRSTWVAHYGSTVANVARVVSTSAYANYAMTIGGDPANTGTNLFAESLGPGYLDPIGNPEGAWMTVNAQPDVIVATTLQQDADGFVALYGDLEPAYTLTLEAGRWSPVDAWLGDTVRLVIRSGRLDVDTSVRITAIGIDVNDNGRETVTLTAGLPPPGLGQLLRATDRRLDKLEAR